jgi:hypothetical protein
MTSIKLGWARRQYGADRFDVELGMTDLPRILAEHKADPAAAETMPFSTAIEILRLEAEIIGKGVYYRHEQTEAQASGATRATAAMMALKAEVPALRTERDMLLAPYKITEAVQA